MKLNDIKANFDKWIIALKEDETKQSTLNQYKIAVTTFINYLEANQIEEVSKMVVIDYKDFLKKKYKENTVTLKITALNKFLSFCNADNLKVKVEKSESNVAPEVLTLADYNRLMNGFDRLIIEQPRKAKSLKQIRLITEVLAGTGMRISELQYLTVEVVTKEGGIFDVYNKGKKRTVTIPKALMAKLRAYIKENGIKKGIIFHAKDPSKMIDKAYYWRQLKYVAGQVRLKKSKIHAHAFRHFFSKMALEEINMPLTELSDILGHSSVDITKIYVKKTPKELQSDVGDVYNHFKR